MPESLYETVGGEPAVHALVERFYAVMDELPEAATVRAMHPPDLSTSRKHLEWFLTGWLGGPQVYIENRGHPRLRARHLPFAIDKAAAEAWMVCMRRALAETLTPEVVAAVEPALARLAGHMVNQGEGQP